MTGDRAASKWSWPQALVLIWTAQAFAVALWLVPASIHIVKWPAASGPVRLALLAPAWQLLVLCSGAFALAVLALALGKTRSSVVSGFPAAPSFGETRRSGNREGGSRTIADGLTAGTLARQTPGGGSLAPFLLLWLWVVPYLPWLPDRLPLLLVLAGPIRWVIPAAALALVLFETTGIRERLAIARRVGRRTVFVASLAAFLALGLNSAYRLGLGGDEPHYLIITESLLKDQDLKIENNHRQRDYQSFYPGELRPDFFERGKNGEIYSIHAPGLPALILPAYVLGGRLGVVAFFALMAALTALAIFDLADAIAGRGAALITWAASCLTVPFVPYAWLIFPEMPGALVVAWASLWLWQSIDRSALSWAWRGAVLGALPWLHTKFVVLLAIFAAALMLRVWRRPRSFAAFVTPMAVSGVLWLYSFYAIYGVFDPEAPYGAYTGIYVLTRNIPHGLLGIFFDQKFGLLFYSPIYLAAIAGAWLILRRPDTRALGAVLLLATAAFVGTTARLYMYWGGNSGPARFLVPVLPCLTAMVALAVAHARSAASRALIGLWLAISLGLAAAGVLWPDRFMLFSDPHAGGARILEAIQGGSPLAAVLPGFSNPDWASHLGQLVWWLSAAAIALAAMMLTSRLRQRASPWLLAGVASLTFLVVGAIASAEPAAEVKNATASRGDLDVLWRFDGNRFRTFDYETLGRANPERFRELTTVEIQPQPSQITEAGYAAGPMTVPPGAFATRVWFANARSREGEVIVSAPPSATFGRSVGPLANPSTVNFDLPVAVRRLMVRVTDARAAAAIKYLEIVPLAVVPAGEREDVPVRTIESIPGRAGAYLIYVDGHAYPEGGVFWSRGTAETTVWLAPGNRSRLTLTLSTGPMSGAVTVSAGGKASTVAMAGGEVKVVSFELPPGQRLVPLTVQSDVMFRPAELDKTSTDMRGLGCQVRIDIE